MTDCTILHADCRDISAADCSAFSALICDPPYSAHVHANAASHGTNGRGSRPRDLGFECLANDLRAHVLTLAAAVGGWSIVFTDLESVGDWKRAANSVRGLEYVRSVPWVRWSQPQLSGDRPPSGAEGVMQFGPAVDEPPGPWPAPDTLTHLHPRGRKRWSGPGSLTHYSSHCMRGANKHPTEKPLDLMLDLVSWFSAPGEAVLDPFAGAGTTILAARLLERSGSVGIELNDAWAALAEQRVNMPLSARDLKRAEEWIVRTRAEASRVPEPKDDSQLRTYERAQRRLADADRVAEAIHAT